MTRVIGGTAGGRRLTVPPGTATRPTSDRAREALFSALTSMLAPAGLRGTRLLDLYAGSGAVGLEALSRGARQVLLVDSDRRAADTVRANVAALGLPGAQVVRDDVARLAAGPNPGEPYDVAFLDPPYPTPAGSVAAVLSALAEHGWLRPGALVVVERASRDDPWVWPAGLAAIRDRRYGEGTLWYGRAAWSGDPRRDPE
ncbi:MAG: 16S rRNA (guanine(966)-N(2))-methyltransferase RsmD [Actinomycetes bacterium]